MADLKHSYEFMLVLSVTVGEKTEELLNKFKSLIEENAELKDVNDWVKKKLAYMINKEPEGRYVLFQFESDANFPKELERISNITEGVLRFIIVKKSA